jgi:hypothetical protein
MSWSSLCKPGKRTRSGAGLPVPPYCTGIVFARANMLTDQLAQGRRRRFAEQVEATKRSGVYERSKIMPRKTKTPASEKTSAIRRATPAKTRGTTHGRARQVSPAHLLRQAFNAPETLTPADVLALQQTAGNRAVQYIFGALLKQIDDPCLAQSKSAADQSGNPQVPIAEGVALQLVSQPRMLPPPPPSPSTAVIQRQVEEKESLPGKFESTPRTENRTGLPDNLKAGIESLSGISMDDVRVHYNSPKPTQFQALAYTQGTDIHVGPGQEAHLSHEAWHVVQQKQGRVKPTLQAKGVAINDDASLENEATIAGGKAARERAMDGAAQMSRQGVEGCPPIQLMVHKVVGPRHTYYYTDFEESLRAAYPTEAEALEAERQMKNPSSKKDSETKGESKLTPEKELDALLKEIGTSQLSDSAYNAGRDYAVEHFNFKGHRAHGSNAVARNPKQRLKEMFDVGATIEQLKKVKSLWGL